MHTTALSILRYVCVNIDIIAHFVTQLSMLAAVPSVMAGINIRLIDIEKFTYLSATESNRGFNHRASTGVGWLSK